MQWGRRSGHMSPFWQYGYVSSHVSRLLFGSLQNSRKSWHSPCHPDTHTHILRLSLEGAWHCSFEWLLILGEYQWQGPETRAGKKGDQGQLYLVSPRLFLQNVTNVNDESENEYSGNRYDIMIYNGKIELRRIAHLQISNFELKQCS